MMNGKKRMVLSAGVFAAMVSLVLAGVLAGCSSSPKPARPAPGKADLPEWYLNPAAVYPDDVYLTAVGTGDTRRAAEQQAMAGLSQIFEANIQVDMTTQERYRDIVTAQGDFSEAEVELAQTTSVQSAQRLTNVQMGEAAVDESGRVHAIAYIERLPTGRLYVDLIEKNAAQVASFLTQADASDNLIREYAYVSAAWIIASGNELLRDQLRIIAPSMGQMVQLPYSYDSLIQRRTDIASGMRVSISITGDTGDRVEGVVRQALGEERFPVSATDPVLRVTGRVQVEPIELTSDFESARWVLNLDVAGPDGSSIVSYDDQGRSSAVTTESAIAFAYRDIQAAVKNNFVSRLRGYFDGLVLGD
ncbi:LPP20 lipoprotein [Alkalispirochaeta americana]|uniref:LPP20 lipoprotein n=2 Tax=Alkalispirochaeta americana TaxID=159291 RepID=A0A1N6V891_9SPIO|nr:LPP20 lipoprotein [Alkalispirochaeta americana]